MKTHQTVVKKEIQERVEATDEEPEHHDLGAPLAVWVLLGSLIPCMVLSFRSLVLPVRHVTKAQKG